MSELIFHENPTNCFFLNVEMDALKDPFLNGHQNVAATEVT